MRGLRAVLDRRGDSADDLEWPPGVTDQATKTLRALRDLRARLPRFRFTAAPELIANRVLRSPPCDSPPPLTRKPAIYPAAVDPEQARGFGDVAA
jgi:hypothetical protein